MAILDDYKNSNLGLKGQTPKVREGATPQSPIHTLDTLPGVQGNEKYNIKSNLDLDGKTPETYRDKLPEGVSF